MTLSAGTRLGAYEITAPIGAGGMGEVYQARDTRLNRDVAIKVLPEAFANDPDRLARFKREAQVLASLNHPHIAAIYGLEEAAGASALILELVEGPTLADRIAKGPIPVDEALPIAKQVCEALEVAHEQGIIHRDLKPANVKLTPDGTVKVLDFGLAKSTSGPSNATTSLSPTITSPAMTMAGMLLGSAAYMSPEQAKGREADKRSDVWGFGCVLYEMLTGKRAFDGEDLTETIAAVVKSEPDLSALPAEVPAHVRLLIRRCLEKDRHKRVSDISTARFVLVEPLVSAETVPHRQSTSHRDPVWKRAAPVIAVAIIASVVVGAVVWRFKPIPLQPVTRFSYRLGDGQQFTNAGRHLLAVSPDGTQLAYVANLRLYLKSSWELDANPIRGTEGAQTTTPVFSPDGASLVFYSGAVSIGARGTGVLKKIATNGGAAVTLCEADNPYGISWDGESILFGQADKGVLRVSAGGGTPEILVRVKGKEIAHGPQMLPDGQSLLYTLAPGIDWDSAQIVVQRLASSERKTVIQRGADARYLPTGHIVYALGGVLFAIPFDARRLEVIGGPVPVVEGVRRGGANGAAAQFAVSRSGSLAYIPGASTAVRPLDLALVDRKGMVDPLKLPSQSYQLPRFSPDGLQLAVGTDDGKEANIWIYELSGKSSIRRLTFGGNNHYPTWTSDGARIAFQSDREGDSAIFWQRADGTGTAERLTKPEKGMAHIPLSSSRRGDVLLFSVGAGSKQSLWIFSLQDKKAVPFGAVMPTSLQTGATFSPDGRWIAYQLVENGSAKIFVQPYPATGATYQIAEGNHAVWGPSGKELFFSRVGLDAFSVVNVMTEPSFTFGNTAASTPRPAYVGRGDLRNWDLAPDGHAFVFVVDKSDPANGNAPIIRVVLNWFEELKRLVPVN